MTEQEWKRIEIDLKYKKNLIRHDTGRLITYIDNNILILNNISILKSTIKSVRYIDIGDQ